MEKEKDVYYCYINNEHILCSDIIRNIEYSFARKNASACVVFAYNKTQALNGFIKSCLGNKRIVRLRFNKRNSVYETFELIKNNSLMLQKILAALKNRF